MTDSSTGSRNFDPRFDPAFQPGYDPSVDDRQAGGSGTRAAARASDRIAPPPIVVLDGNTEQQSGADEETASAPVIRRVDPYLIGLWVLSAVFFAAGLFVVRYIIATMDRLNSTGAASFDYNLMLMYTIAAPLLMVLGLATATGTLFLLAARRRR